MPRYRHESWARKLEIDVHPQTRKAVFVIFTVAVGILGILSFFGMAGQFGRMLDNALALVFGWDRIIFPVALILISISLYGITLKSRTPNILGLVLFFLSLNGMIHFLAFPAEGAIDAVSLGQGGGYVGLVLSYPFIKWLGFWGTTVILSAFIVSSIVLMFNANLSHVLVVIKIIFFAVGKVFSLLGRAIGFARRPGQLNLFGRLMSKKDNLAAGDAEGGAAPDFKSREVSGGDSLELPAESSAESTGAKTAGRERKRRMKIDLPLELLDNREQKPNAGDIKMHQMIIQKTLENFGIPVEMGEVSVGPTVAQYTLKPAEGVKLSRITALQNDLALALAAHPIRMEAPIPGKALVGIEVPNQQVAVVGLREVLDSAEFKGRKSNMMIALGKDVAGKPWLASLDKMPHLLVAGATNSGKTVCLNAIIVSLLYQNGPDDLKFILIDPKRVELPVYNGIPHLITPVITEVPKIVNALRWAIGEMERRFDVLSRFGKRDIGSLNRETDERMPYLVIIIDELADLMVAAASEVEASIIRLAQMSRAVGIHLVVATQRPSVDIITGLIKANITSRLAFSVASSVDSRTILDSTGAEKLLGRGDMLYVNAGLSKPKRLQGAYVSDADTKRVVGAIITGGVETEYDETVVEKQNSVVLGIPGMPADDDDELLPDAKEILLQAGKGSASLLQRRLKIGYSRAARILDILERQRFIGPADGAKPREILVAGAMVIGGRAGAAPAFIPEEPEEEKEEFEEF
ncbi:MAG: DNA translocase FtsK 4TM domain-containing protein [Patescibacteria group bacterium]